MKIVANYSQSLDIDKVDELLICPNELSRHGVASYEELAPALKSINKRKVLVWDILMVQKDFEYAQKLIENIDLSLFDSIRVQDLGALEYMRVEHPNIPVQFNAETGFHNTKSLVAICQSHRKLEKIIVSLELSKDKLKEIIQELSPYSIHFEIMAIGPLLLFYSPRNLLSPHFNKSAEGIISVNGKSEETPHKGFRITENRHGTFMFHPKDHSLLDYLDELKTLGVDHFRVDSTELVAQTINFIKFRNSSDLEVIKKSKPHIKGYFNVNKSDALFTRLKNKHFIKKEDGFIGEVLSSQKESYIAIKILKEGLVKGAPIKIVTPEGKEKRVLIKKIWNSRGDELSGSEKGSLAYIDYIKGVSKRSFVYNNATS
ncbi:MAG: peptidase U32 family protein [Bacteriovoracaceae bacterium]